MEWRLNHVGQMAQSVQDYSIKEMTCEAELCNEEKENFDDMVQQGVSVIFRNQNNKISLMSFMEKKGVRMKC